MNSFLDDLVRRFFGEEEELRKEPERVEIIEDLSEKREENTVREVEDWTNGRPYPLENPSYSPITKLIT